MTEGDEATDSIIYEIMQLQRNIDESKKKLNDE